MEDLELGHLQDVIIRGIANLSEKIGAKSAQVMISHIERNGLSLQPPDLVALANAGPNTGILRYLGNHLSDITFEGLETIFEALGVPYANLAAPGPTEFNLPHSEEVKNFLIS